MAFQLPDVMPTTVDELLELRTEASVDYEALRDKVKSGESLDDTEYEYLKSLVESLKSIDSATVTAREADEAREKEISGLFEAGDAGVNADADAETDDPADADADADDATGDDPADADADADVDADKEPVLAASTTGARRKTTYSGLGKGKSPKVPTGRGVKTPGWKMVPGSPLYKAGAVGFKDIADAIDSVKQGSRVAARPNRANKGSFSAQALAALPRELPNISDPHALVREIERATDQSQLPGESLLAAGGWCAPSETLYDFCDVPDATDLISLPEISINRGGVRWPNEPDISAILAGFQFFFTETELEDTDEDGAPTAIKECVEIPCPDTFTELRLNAVGYCVEAGILQDQGWPELTEWFMRSLAAEHLKAISRRTILDMVAGSGTVKVVPATGQIGVASSFLNSLTLMAVNLRLQKGLSRNAVIEFVAPNWVPDAIRADLTMQGMDGFAVTDAQIQTWLSARYLSPQWVADWQSRATNLPGDLATLVWPSTVDVVMYPAGTWFRAMSNVIEMGVMYPKEQLQVNRYTRFFTEDAIAVGKRCNQSINVRIPICPSGAIGARQNVLCNPLPA